jgi:hypothetical protein
MTDKAADRRLVGQFCGSLADLINAAEELEIVPALEATRIALASGPAAPADVVRQFQLAVGLAEKTRGVTIPGQDPTPPPAGDYGCPHGICNRRAEREPGGAVPLCQVYVRPMQYLP